MYTLVLAIPAISAFITGLFGKFLGKNGVRFLNITCMFLTLLVSCLIFYEVALLKYVTLINLGTWFSFGEVLVEFELYFDSITATMLLVVSIVSFLVHVYSLDYMGEDPHSIRFMTYLTLFTLFMFVLLTAGNFIQFFAGWEGVGLASYLLINFWYTRTQANTSALKALVVNRFGDFALYVGMLVIFATFKTTSFLTVFSLAETAIPMEFSFFGGVPAFMGAYAPILSELFQFNVSTIEFICFFLFIGAVGKSAQLGLHIWLPDAMEGPTPVSALIHAATMVTAGVFLIIRCSPLFELAPTTLKFVTVVGALTAFFAATVGLMQNDLKKVIAYSTCSQLGYMVFACGSSGYNASFYHLINHAFFKALLFLCAGSVIHALANEQDIRRMGGVVKILPITYVMMLIGSLSLLGFPYLTGFYSKDVILEITLATNTTFGLFAYTLGVISVFFTAFYSCRLLHLTFFGHQTNTLRNVVLHAHESPKYMLFAFFPLAIGSIYWGFWTKDMFVGLGSDFWQGAIVTAPANYVLVEAEFLPLELKLLPMIISFSGVAASFLIYYTRTGNQLNFLRIKKLFGCYSSIIIFLNRKWNFDFVYNRIFVKPYMFISYFITFKYIDRGILEYFGPLGVVRLSSKLGSSIMKLHSGLLYRYVFLIILFLLAFILFTVNWGNLSSTLQNTTENSSLISIDLIYFLALSFLFSVGFWAYKRS